jgi:hypothetical protein
MWGFLYFWDMNHSYTWVLLHELIDVQRVEKVSWNSIWPHLVNILDSGNDFL